jgi:hypothetical protein
MLGTDDVLMVRPEGVEGLGWPIRDVLFDTSYDTSRARAGFDPRLRRYRLYVPPVNPGDESIVWDYYVDRQRWFHVKYPFLIRNFVFKDISYTSLSMNELSGTFDSLTGTMDDLSTQSAREPTTFMAVGGAADRVVYETDGLLNDVNNSTGAPTIEIPIELRTGEIFPSTELDTLEVIKFQLLYEAILPTIVDIEYSEDGGTTWTGYGQITLPVTTAPTTAVFRKTLYRNRMQFRVTSDSATGLKLYGLYVKTVRGSSINP